MSEAELQSRAPHVLGFHCQHQVIIVISPTGTHHLSAVGRPSTDSCLFKLGLQIAGAGKSPKRWCEGPSHPLFQRDLY